MLHSLKSKFIIAFGTLLLVLFANLGIFLVNAKTEELSADISEGAQSFASLTVKKIIQSYAQYLEPGNFVSFNRDITEVLKKTDSVSAIEIFSYGGEILYFSETETREPYSGDLRLVEDEALMERIQAGKTSILYEDGTVVYTKVDEKKNTIFVDFNEVPIETPSVILRIKNIIVPSENAYSVLYTISYDTMDARLFAAEIQIGIIAGVGLILVLMISFILATSITNPLKALTEGATKIAAGDFTAQVSSDSKDEIGTLAGTFNRMAKDLAASIDVKLYKERVAKELELAGQIQLDLLPKARLELPDLEVSGGLHAATEIGGDAFDFIKMDDGDYVIYLGDVSGHGVPSGIISSIANALLYAMRSETDLKTIAHRLNAVIQEKSTNTMFMTMALTEWCPRTKSLNYVNLGHLPPLFYNAKEKKVVEIKKQGMALGLVDEIKNLEQHNFPLAAEDVIVLYSDGIPEARNAQDEQYGMQRLKRIAQQAGDDLLTAEGIKNAIFADVMQFIGSRDHLDDITLVVMKRRG